MGERCTLESSQAPAYRLRRFPSLPGFYEAPCAGEPSNAYRLPHTQACHITWRYNKASLKSVHEAQCCKIISHQDLWH